MYLFYWEPRDWTQQRWSFFCNTTVIVITVCPCFLSHFVLHSESSSPFLSFYRQEGWNIYEPWGGRTNAPDVSLLVPQTCFPFAYTALPPTLWIHELLPCHSQSSLGEDRPDLSKWRNVKTLLRGLTDSLKSIIRTHRTSRASRTALHSNTSIQSDNGPQLWTWGNSQTLFPA